MMSAFSGEACDLLSAVMAAVVMLACNPVAEALMCAYVGAACDMLT